MSTRLDRVRFVLVHTTHPGNIGATARAMKAMCLEQLCLVAPRRFPCAEATARAAGADDLLQRALVCEDLSAALSDCVLVVGTSARRRSLGGQVLSARECAGRVLLAAADGPVAVVFGREDSGLSNEELDRCQLLVHIPTSRAFRSLNIAAAAQIIAYELLVESGAAQSRTVAPEARPATAAELESFFTHLYDTLTEIGFIDPAQPRLLMRRLRHLFHRAQPDAVEINILRGILSAAQRAAMAGPRDGEGREMGDPR